MPANNALAHCHDSWMFNQEHCTALVGRPDVPHCQCLKPARVIVVYDAHYSRRRVLLIFFLCKRVSNTYGAKFQYLSYIICTKFDFYGWHDKWRVLYTEPFFRLGVAPHDTGLLQGKCNKLKGRELTLAGSFEDLTCPWGVEHDLSKACYCKYFTATFPLWST